MVLRSSGKTGVWAATVKMGSRVAGRASAWIVGGARFFCWLFASRSITQKEAALGGQVCVVMPFDDGCIAWQWVMAVRLGWWCWRHWAPQTKEAAWVTSRANVSTTMVVDGTRRATDRSRRVTTGSGYAFQKSCGGASPGFPVDLDGAGELHAAFLNERRTYGRWWGRVAGNPGRPVFFSPRTLRRTRGTRPVSYELFGV
jgi:hypothetical protein